MAPIAGPSKPRLAPPKPKAKSIQSTASLLPNLPGAIQVERFDEARALEILAFQNAIKSAASFGNSRVFQSLPRHLRRRAASHNPKRVPKRLRTRAAAEIDPGDNIAKAHKKRAKLRANGDLRGRSRTEQLLSRQRNKQWLPTHIWHAKRFHMVNLWGYRLPLTPTLKSFRPAYRASTRRCAVHDASYFATLEIENVEVLKRITAGRYGGEYENGKRKADVLFYQVDAYPRGLIGPGEIMWNEGRVWARVHPSIRREVEEAVKAAEGSSELVDIDSFELTGPTSGTILRKVLRGVKGLALPEENEISGGRVYDPRLHFPPKKVDSRTPPLTHISEIWHDRPKPLFKKSDLDKRKRPLRPLAQDSRIPMLLIGRSNGYTLLIPRGWSQYLLTSFAYTGCLIAGLAERRAQHREAGIPCFPEHWGGVCKAGDEWEEQKLKEELTRWSRKPPGKRLQPPQRFVWGDEETTINDPVWSLQTPLLDRLAHITPSTLRQMIDAFRTQRNMPQIHCDISSCVIQVKVNMLDRGSPKDNALIYSGDRIIGYVTTGNFSLSRGKGHALGIVRLEAYLENRLVKVRNHDGVVYRSAELS